MLDTLRPMFDIYKAKTSEANELASNIKAATQDQGQAINAILDTSTEERIAKWRDEYNERQAKIDAAIESQKAFRKQAEELAASLLPNADFDEEAARNDFLSLRRESTEIKKALMVFLGGDQEKFDEIIEELGIVEVISLRGSTTKGATGVRRPRITSATVNGEPVANEKGRVSITYITNHIISTIGKIDADVVRKALFAATETEDLATVKDQTFNFSVTTEDGKQVSLSVTV